MGVFTAEGVNNLTVRLAGGSALDFPFVNSFVITPNTVTLQFRGDHTSQRIYRTDGITGTMAFDKWTTDFMVAQDITEVTAALPSGYASRYYPETGTLPYLETACYEFVTDDDTGTDTLFALTIFKTKLQPFVPAPLGNIAVVTNTFQWSGTPTLDGIDAAPLTGVSTQKVVYSLDIHS